MTVQQRTLSTVQAAEYLGVSKSYLDGLRCYRPKDSPPFAKIGARVVYPIVALDKWLENRTNESGQPKK